jgi:hypothetical protein
LARFAAHFIRWPKYFWPRFALPFSATHSKPTAAPFQAPQRHPWNTQAAYYRVDFGWVRKGWAARAPSGDAWRHDIAGVPALDEFQHGSTQRGLQSVAPI